MFPCLLNMFLIHADPLIYSKPVVTTSSCCDFYNFIFYVDVIKLHVSSSLFGQVPFYNACKTFLANYCQASMPWMKLFTRNSPRYFFSMTKRLASAIGIDLSWHWSGSPRPILASPQTSGPQYLSATFHGRILRLHPLYI